jgi:two-component system, cell cycle sensor histidine kinase and response regulator CckA
VDHKTARQKNIPEGLYVLLTVTDTGHGIAADILERVFEPFFSTKGQDKGTGLGLSTVMGIVKTHGGKVEFTTKIGRGTAFSVYLPAAERPDSAPSDPIRPEIPRGNGETILLVDDESAILEILRFQLESYGYRVITANNGADAVELYRGQAPEIAAVVTDVMMPVMDGSKAVRAISQINPGAKIIGMSGLHDTLNLGVGHPMMGAFLTKPFTTSELLGTLHYLLVT